MNRIRWFIIYLFACIAFLMRPLVADESPIWNPERTWVFAVGILEWQHPELWSPFPSAKVNRRDELLVRFFERSGVPKTRIVYLQDNHATKARIETEFGKLLGQTQSGDLLVFYFCGHGARDRRSGTTWFANYDAAERYENAWDVREIFTTIEQRFHGHQCLLLADCCHSGALYDIANQYQKSRIGYATLTSSSSHNSSTGKWTFSDSVLAGLQGDAAVDLDGDRSVTLAEIAKHSESELAFVDGQKSMFYASNGFPASIRLAFAKPPLKPHIGNRIEVEYRGKWYKAKTIDADGPHRKVHYVNFDSSWDEWVGIERRRPYQPPQFAAGDKVIVRWEVDKQWYPATVRDSWYGLHLVRYDNYGASADEWIGPAAIQLQGESVGP